MNLDVYNALKDLKAKIGAEDRKLCAYHTAHKATLPISEQLRMQQEHNANKATYAMLVEDIKRYEQLMDLIEQDKSHEKELIYFQDVVIKKYNLEIKKKESTEVVATRKAKKKTRTKILAYIMAGAMLIGTGALGQWLLSRNRNNKNEAKFDVKASIFGFPRPTETPKLENAEGEEVEIDFTTPTPEPTPVPTPEPTPAPTPAPTPEPTPVATPEPTVEAAVEEVVAEMQATEEMQPVEDMQPIELPFESFGQFTDATNEAQLRARAEWMYTNYVSNRPSPAGENRFSVEELMNDLRIMNGEFMLKPDGSPTFNAADIIDAVNDVHTIANYDSFKQYGTNIYFTPMAPLFLDGSVAQQIALKVDEIMIDVVEAIRAQNNEAFVEAATRWGIFYMNLFEYVDFTGEYPSIHQVPYPVSFNLYHAIDAKYASTILEYAQAHGLNICIPYCIDPATNQEVKVALSEIRYQINDVARDANAARAGHADEYAQENLSLPERLFVGAKAYYDSKYETEIGCGLIRK